MGSEVDVASYLSSRYFDVARFGLFFGFLSSVYGASIGLSSWLAGAAYDRVGSYAPVLSVLMVGCGLAIVLVIAMDKAPPIAAPPTTESRT